VCVSVRERECVCELVKVEGRGVKISAGGQHSAVVLEDGGVSVCECV